jgi:polyribonucleotide nucleotidyltransferase
VDVRHCSNYGGGGGDDAYSGGGVGHTSTVEVPNDLVGPIIGRGGASLDIIRDATNTRIQFLDDGATPAETTVNVVGSPADVAKAIAMINARVEELSHRFSGLTSRVDASNADASYITQTLDIQSHLIGGIIGRGGAGINAIQSASQARVDIARADAQRTSRTSRTATVTGPPEAVAVALDMLEARVAELLANDAPDGEYHVGDAVAGEFTQTIEIPRALVSDIIGQRGADIRDIRVTSRTRINIPNTGEPRMVTVTGSTEGVAQAIEMLTARMEELAVDYESTETIEVPSELMGAVIGRHGVTINAIRDTTRAVVKIFDNEVHAGVATVTISGTAEAVAEAHKMISAHMEQANHPQY